MAMRSARWAMPPRPEAVEAAIRAAVNDINTATPPPRALSDAWLLEGPREALLASGSSGPASCAAAAGGSCAPWRAWARA